MLLIIPLIWLLFGLASAMAASSRGRSGCGWFVLGVLLGPFGLIFALLSKPQPSPPVQVTVKTDALPPPVSSSSMAQSPPSVADDTKTCLACAETIKLAALKCRYCGDTFDPEEVARQVAARQAELADAADRRSRGQMQCPLCGFWDVHRAYLPDGSMGPWCPHCQKPVHPFS